MAIIIGRTTLQFSFPKRLNSKLQEQIRNSLEKSMNKGLRGIIQEAKNLQIELSLRLSQTSEFNRLNSVKTLGEIGIDDGRDIQSELLSVIIDNSEVLSSSNSLEFRFIDFDKLLQDPRTQQQWTTKNKQFSPGQIVNWLDIYENGNVRVVGYEPDFSLKSSDRSRSNKAIMRRRVGAIWAFSPQKMITNFVKENIGFISNRFTTVFKNAVRKG